MNRATRRFMRCLCIGLITIGAAATEADRGAVYVPTTVSKPWQAFWSHFQWPSESLPGPEDTTGWDATREKHDALIRGFANPNLARDMHVQLNARNRNGVPVLEVQPANVGDKDKVILYLHGGAYTFQTPQLNLLQAALMANATRFLTISVDYTLAPRGKWTQALEEVISVYRALLDAGYKSSSIGLFGDSAGGGLAAGSALKIRDLELPVPGAIVLWSPWSDITSAGDTYVTLAGADPLLSVESLRASAAAYAAPGDQRNPYVSPVYGAYSRAYPPTLIQGGTKEIFLSNFIRLYQAIDVGGGVAILDLYEGMPHVFQIMNADTIEAKLALRKSADFFKTHLVSATNAVDR